MAFRSFPHTLFSLFILASAIVHLAHAAPPNNTLYIISNAETPSLRLPGLTPVGLTRVQDCLPPLLAPLDIGLIIACPFDPDSGLCKQTEATARPTAEYIGLEVDTSCGADEETDDDCVPDLIKQFGRNSTQSVLIVWDINDLDSLFENLDVDDDWEDDDDDDDDDDDEDDVEDDLFQHHDVLYTIVQKRMTSIISQGCAGIDGQAPGSFRRRSLTFRGLREERKRHMDSEKSSSAWELVEQPEELEERAEGTETEEKEGKNLKRNEEKAQKELAERRSRSRVMGRH